MANILLIDDDTTMCGLYELILTSAGYKVVTANDGPTGLEKVGQEQFNLILLDIMMPKMNGFEVMEKLKSDPKTAIVPIVIISNFADEKYQRQALEKGAACYLVKSDYEPDDLVKILAGIMNGQAVPHQPAQAA